MPNPIGNVQRYPSDRSSDHTIELRITMDERIPRTPWPNLSSLGTWLIRRIRRTLLEDNIIGPPDPIRQGRILNQVCRISTNEMQVEDMVTYGVHPHPMDTILDLIIQALLIMQQRQRPPPKSTCIFRDIDKEYTQCETALMPEPTSRRRPKRCFEVDFTISHSGQCGQWGLLRVSLFPVIRHDLHPARLCTFHDTAVELALERLLWTSVESSSSDSSSSSDPE